MKKALVWVAVGLVCAGLLWAATVNGSLNVLGTLSANIVDFSGAASTAPMKSGTSLPGVCAVGQTYFKTDAAAGQNIYLCTAANTWSQVVGGGGGGYSVVQDEGAALASRPTVDVIGRGVVGVDNGTLTQLYFLDPRRFVFEWDDFIQQGNTTSGNVSKLGWGVNGGTVQASPSGYQDRPGLLQWTTSAGAAGTIYVGGYNNRNIHPGNLKSLLAIVWINRDDDYVDARIGLMDATAPASVANGVFIENSLTDTAWWGTVMTGGVKTRTGTSLAATNAGGFLVFHLEKIASNQVRFKVAPTIGEALDPAGAQVVTATLPAVTCYLAVQAAVAAGGTTTYATVDYVDILLEVAR